MVLSFRITKGRFWSDNNITSLGVMGGLLQLGYPDGIWSDLLSHCSKSVSQVVLVVSGTSFSRLEEVLWPWLLWVPSPCLSSFLLCVPWFWSIHSAHRKSTGGLSSFKWPGRRCVTCVCTTLSIICKSLLPRGKAVCSFGCTELIKS